MEVHNATGLDGLSGGLLQGWTVRRPFLAVGLSAVAATALALWVPVWVAVLLAAIAIGSCFVRWFRRPLWWVVALSVALFLLTTSGYRCWKVEPLTALTGREDTLTGQVVAEPESGRMYTLEVTRAGLVPEGTQVALFLPDELAPRLWDTVTTRVTLTGVPLSGYQPGRGIYLYAFPLQCDEAHVQMTAATSSPAVAALGDRLYAGLREALPGEEGSVLAALCLGRDESLSSGIEEAFRDSGLGHLLVVSGLHLSLVVLALRAFLRRVGIGFRMSAVLTVPVMVLFMALVGASPSVMRAGTMCLCWLVGLMSRRRSDGLNSLGLAAALLLLQNPYQLLNAGFQLSFLATAGVLCLPPRLCGWLYRRPVASTPLGRLGQKAVSFVYSTAAVCVSAMLFTLPVLCYYFEGFSLSTLLANVLAVVPASGVLLLGWLGILCCSVPFLAWLGQPILWVAGYGTRYLIWVAEHGQWPSAQVSTNTLWQWLLVTVLCLLLIYALLRRLSLRRFLPPLLALAVLTLTAGQSLAVPVTRLTIQPCDDGVALLLEQGEHAALLVTHSSGLEDAARLVQERGRSRLDWIVVGEGETAYAGTLADLHRQTGQPILGTTAQDTWFSGLSYPVHRLPLGQSVTLWEGYSLTPATLTWWRLDTESTPLNVGGDARIPCPLTDGMTVYAGLPREVQTPSVVACSLKQLTQRPPDYAGETLLLTDESVTFTIRPGGEWSVLPWL